MAPVKILFLGYLNPILRSYQRKRALEELTYLVQAYPLVPVDLRLHQQVSLWKRVLWKLGFPPDRTQANAVVEREIERYCPDILWIETGNTIWPWTLRAIRSRSPHTKIVAYSEDDMFLRRNRSQFYTWGLKYYDVVFTTKSYNCRAEELPALGAKRVVMVDKAFDIYAHRPIPATPEGTHALGGDVGFIGSFEDERAKSLCYLAAKGISVRVWGQGGWQKMMGKHPLLQVENRPLLGDEYARGLSATRINLCFLRKLNRDLQTARTMEIPACGAFMLAERTAEHSRLFAEGREAVFFNSDAEMLEKTQYYLAHEAERKAIALAGRQRCLTSGYSHHDRLKYMLSVVASV